MELIKINENRLVSGKELHCFLGVGRDFSTWIKEKIKKYDFVENTDFIIEITTPQNGGIAKDYVMTIDMSKELSMVENNEKGKEARKYFIKCEKKLKENGQPKESYTIQDPIERAKAWIKEQEEKETLLLTTKKQEQVINELKPKADYTDLILKNKGLVTITQIAKDYGMSGQELNKKLHDLKIQYKQSGQWLLYSSLQDKGYTHSETISIVRTGGIPDVNMITKWTQKGRLFLYDSLKENYLLPLIER
jgi:anti-repressor protein